MSYESVVCSAPWSVKEDAENEIKQKKHLAKWQWCVSSISIVISIIIDKVYFGNPVNQQPEMYGAKEKLRNNKMRYLFPF